MAKHKPHWTEGLRQALTERGNAPKGEGWMTSNEIRVAIGRGMHFTYNLIAEKLKSGEWESYTGSAVDIRGHANTRIWYRPKNLKA